MARHSASDAGPRILPLIGSRPGSLRDVVESLVIRAAAAHAEVRVTLDAAAGNDYEADAAAVRGLLEPLVAAAFHRASGPLAETDGPALREVDVAVVATADALEVEVADSGADRSPTEGVPPAVRDLAARCGAQVSATSCAAGGLAVTVRFPRREARRQAA
ncbi:MAG: hypothetical protein ACKO4T_08170 [Planctomycetaceae bacterium]